MTQFTQKELDEYWQDTAFNFPLKEKINEVEKLDVYLMNIRSQKMLLQSSNRSVYTIGVFLLSFVLVSLLWFIDKRESAHSIPGLLTISVILGIIIASVITPLFNIYFNNVIFPKLNENKKFIQKINEKQAQWENLRKELSEEVMKPENKEKILHSVDEFKVFIKQELSTQAHEFIESNSLFEEMKQELKTSYEENDTENIIDILADYALCEHEIKEDWKDLQVNE